MVEVAPCVHAAAGHQCKGGADGGASEYCAGVEIIIRFQKGAVNDAEDVLFVFLPILDCQFPGDPLHLIGKPILIRNSKTIFQRCCHHIPVFLLVLPQVRVQPSIIHTARVGNVKHITEDGPALAIVNKGNALGPAPDVPAHPLVPEVVLRAGGSFGPLGVNHELFRERVFLKLLSRGNVRHTYVDTLHLTLHCNQTTKFGGKVFTFSIKLRLCLPELSIKPFLLVKQFLVSAPLGNGPTVKDEHQVTETAGGHPM